MRKGIHRSLQPLGLVAGLLLSLSAVSATPGLSVVREAAALVAASAPPNRIVVLGELHGTNEAPALAGELARIQGPGAGETPGSGVTLALEIHAVEQPRIDAFLESSGNDAARDALLSGPYWAVPTERSDGRRSVAMLAVLESVREMRSADADLRVLAFDPGSAGGDANTRNAQMAATLREAFARDSDRRFVVLIGNYHARRAAPANVRGLMPGRLPPVPTMAHLANLPMLRVNVTAERGQFWACMNASCQPWPVGGRPARASPNEAANPPTPTDAMRRPRFQLTPQDTAVWDAELVMPEYSAAPPVDGIRQR